jgi:hypothetical protein
MQTTWLDGWITWPVGFTVMVKVFVDPVQETLPLVKVGVTTNVPLIGDVPLFEALKEMLPVPVAAAPILELVFVHA